MATLPVCVIEGNPDIAGVGVRVSVYIQSCLAILASMYALIKSRKNLNTQKAILYLDEGDARLVRQIGMTAALTGTALVMSALIEAKSRLGLGISTYHALVVLNLSWVNSLTTLTTFASAGFLRAVGGSAPMKMLIKRRFRTGWPFYVHCGVMSVMGIWFWADPGAFTKHTTSGSDSEDCALVTYYWLFVRINAANPRMRIASLFAYSASGVPVLGHFILLIGLVLLVLALYVALYLLYFVLCVLYFTLRCCLYILRFIARFLVDPILNILRPLSPATIPPPEAAQDSVVTVMEIIDLVKEQINDKIIEVLKFGRGGTTLAMLFAMGLVSPILFLMVATEKLISVNHGIVDPGVEDRWSYGQTLACFAALISVVLCVSEARKVFQGHSEEKSDWDTVIQKGNGVLDGPPDDWNSMRTVVEELERIAWIRIRPKLKDDEGRNWGRDTARLRQVLTGQKDQWEKLWRVSAELGQRVRRRWETENTEEELTKGEAESDTASKEAGV